MSKTPSLAPDLSDELYLRFRDLLRTLYPAKAHQLRH